MAEALLALAMIAAMILLVAGTRMASRREERQRGLLMIAAGLVIAANVAIWTV
jgi:hypothetical protein